MTTTILAIYGAVLSTFTLVVGLFREWWRSRVRVTVTISFGWLHMVGRSNPDPAIDLTAVNRSTFPVMVTGVGFDAQDGSGTLNFLNPVLLRTQLPAKLEPLASLTEAVTPATVAGFVDIEKPVRGWVKLTTGKYHRSEWRRLSPGKQEANLRRI